MSSVANLHLGHHHDLTGAIVFFVVGFFLASLNNTDAREIARLTEHDAMIAALVPNCLADARSDSDRVAKILAINGSEEYLRRDAIIRNGWANIPGSDIASYDLATACLHSLDLAPATGIND